MYYCNYYIITVLLYYYINIWNRIQIFIMFSCIFFLETRELLPPDPVILWIWFGICSPLWDNNKGGIWANGPFYSQAAVGWYELSPPTDPHHRLQRCGVKTRRSAEYPYARWHCLRCVNINYLYAYKSISKPVGGANYLKPYLRSNMTFDGYSVFCPNRAPNLRQQKPHKLMESQSNKRKIITEPKGWLPGQTVRTWTN